MKKNNIHGINFIIFNSGLLILLILFSTPIQSHAQINREYEIKAAFIYNFSQFVEWEELKGDEFNIAVLGHSPITSKLLEVTNINLFKNKKTVVNEYMNINDIPDCELLFISKDANFSMQELLIKFKNKSTLIIGESPGMVKEGININFIILDNKLKFETNMNAINSTKLKLSSNLLKHAVVVEK